MKYFIVRTFSIAMCLSSFTACKKNTEEKLYDNTEKIIQSNMLIDDPENEGEKMLLGLVSYDDFKSEVLFPWMFENHELYIPDESLCLGIKEHIEDVSIKAFMGTWCEDSQREIPHLYKILNMSGFQYESMQMVAVSHDKTTPEGYEKELDIAYVPTFIFYKNGKELGRFVEYAQGASLEEDILTILKGGPYTPAYKE